MHRLSRGIVAIGAALALASVASCASTDDAGDAAPTAEPSDSPADSPSATEDSPLPDSADMPLEAGAHGRGYPPGVDGPTEPSTGAAWSPEPGLLFVVTSGSSTCPRLAEPDASVRDDTVVVDLGDAPDGPCTMDLVPTTSVVAVPGDVEPGAEVTVELGGLGTVVVPAATPGEGGQAAWVGTDPPS